MPFPTVALAIPVATTLLLLLTRKKVIDGGEIIDPIEPPAPGPKPPPVPPVPGGDGPVIDNMFVVDAPAGLRVRAEPSSAAATVARVPNGAQVGVLQFDVPAPPPAPDQDGSERFGWAKVRTAQGVAGFVAARFLSSSGAGGLAERERQEKERQGAEDVLPDVFAGSPPPFGWAGWRRAGRR